MFAGMDWLDSPDIMKLSVAGRMRAALEAAEKAAWRPISEAPHETPVLLGGQESMTDNWECQTGQASGGKLFANGYSNRWFHGRATHFQHLPTPPEAP